jgi:hypothetical protein
MRETIVILSVGLFCSLGNRNNNDTAAPFSNLSSNPDPLPLSWRLDLGMFDPSHWRIGHGGW